jgi:ATP-dependent RNA helicase DDX1
VTLKNCTAQVSFGQQPFRFRPIAGYKPICQASGEHAVIGLTVGGAAPRTSNRSPLAIVLEPARDLAEQTYDAFVSLSKYMTDPEVRSVLIVGGDDDKKINRDLSQGCDVIVATPGKLEALIKKGVVDVSAVRFLVLDEADRLIETENTPMILELYDMIPKGGVGTHRLQVCFFSATLHSDPVQQLSSRICFNPTWVDLKGKDSVPETVHHAVVMIDPTDEQLQQQIAAQLKTRAVTDGVHTPQELKGNSPEAQQARYSQAIKEVKQQMLIQLIDKLQMDQCLIFCRTNVDCSNLERFMLECGGGGGKFRGKQEKGKENPYSCCVLAGMRSMDERRANLQAFKDGDVRFLICTDVAARGIDIKNLPYVINMTLPDEPESYIHRVGRVGRAEAMGLAISLVAAPGFKEKVWFHTCPSKGKGGNCNRRTLVEEGGCTIWYDEPAYFAAIEQRLGTTVPRLGPDLSLPPEFTTNIKYGETLADAQAPQTSVHLDLLQPTVKELAEIEIHAQNIYHNLRFRFA